MREPMRDLTVSLVLGGPEEQRKFLSEQMRVWGAVVREHNGRQRTDHGGQKGARLTAEG
jgi:hypothetical protein